MKHVKTVSVQKANIEDDLGDAFQDFIDIVRAAFDLFLGRAKRIF